MNFTKILFAGIGTFLTPCVYPLIPIYLSSLLGADISNISMLKRGQLFIRAVSFSIGFIMVFSLMGLGAAGIGGLLQEYRQVFQLAGGILILLFALKFLGLITIPFMDKTVRKDDSTLTRKVNLLTAFLMGIFFAAGWSPCIGPILGSILTYTASETSEPMMGFLYLTVYGLGFSIPLLITAFFAESAVKFIGKTSKYLPKIEKVIGVVLLFTSFYFFSGMFGGSDIYQECAYDPVRPDDKPLMVEFYSKGCSVCKKMEPLIKKIGKTCRGKNIEVRQIDISQSENKKFVKKYNLVGVPTFVFINQEGKEVSRLIGKQSKQNLLQAISALMGELCPGVGSIDKHKLPKTEEKGAGPACGTGEEALCTE
ncbi:MAG: cytochrome c biogenesis protein/redoxin [Deltaproteobacteria bacterium]|jgi:cytochrome c-type biogenesis protein|nr:cytochrome c biogenesis protein/redoxin [Deltaproteobacteria bacterium]